MQERRLAAIKHAYPSFSAGRFTDIVGYTALMGSNEKNQLIYPYYALK